MRRAAGSGVGSVAPYRPCLPEFANLFVVCAFPAERAVALP